MAHAPGRLTPVRQSIRILALATIALLALPACGGGGGGGSGTAENAPTAPENISENAPSPNAPKAPPPASVSVGAPPTPPPVSRTASDAALSPSIRFGSETRIGAMPPPDLSRLGEPAATHATATVRYARIRDGRGPTVASYIRDGSPSVTRFPDAPVVRFVEGVTATYLDEIVRAVQLINGNLPRDFQLRIDPTPVSAAEDAAGISHTALAAGQILIEYDRREDWIESRSYDRYVGLERSWSLRGAIITSRVWVDHTRLPASSSRLTVLIHELLHSLSFGHQDPATYPDTVMHETVRGLPGYVMYPIDREALLAVYGTPLDPDTAGGDVAAALGAWEDESAHVRGDLGDIAFGAQARNGLARPWAQGPAPTTDLADNARLSGRVSWNGRLLGLTHDSTRTVAGTAGLTIDLSDLRGNLDFTGLEYWTGRPGATDTGATWGDGDLRYNIEVRGNTFSRRAGAGGDDGIVTGGFFGDAHQGMGGTLTREDLAAGFAGAR